MSSSTRCFACGEMSGPTSTPSSLPAPTLSALAFSTMRSCMRLLSPTKTAVETAMQRCPAAPNAAPVSAFTVDSSAASGITTAWFFAPMLDCTRFPFAEPRAKTWRPPASDPTKEMAWMSGWSQMPFTTSCVPCTTFSTPGGKPASSAISASIIAAPGSRSDGFSTCVFPHVTAIGNIHNGIIAGKLNGQMPAVTPSGCLMEYVSIRLLTFSTSSPITMFPIPQACSTTSRPRKTSPRASASVFPCSRVMLAESSSMCSRMIPWSLNMTRCLVETGVRRHATNASFALSTARLSSAAVASGTRVTTSCVAGSCTS
mmetsp:Transcript_28350/g.92588  ORF Transcript_28350/g.92588 Transcript_28350/m.92588 type:complete len:315 (-) Transcript_28350:127-1071(-)